MSAFGFSGTNVHVVLRAATTAEARAEDVDGAAVAFAPSPLILPVSSSTPGALRAQLSAFGQALLGADDSQAASLCRAAADRRDALACRAAVVADNPGMLAERLAAASARTDLAVVTRQPLVAFLFTGQTAQSTGMAAELMRRDACFRERVLSIDRRFAELQPGDAGPFTRLRALPDGAMLPTDVAQGANFCTQVALTEWLRRANVQPAAVVGHSVGEVAAAYVGGLLALDDAIRLIAARGRLMLEVEGQGRMIAVRGQVESFARAMKAVPAIDLAAVNGPGSIVVACAPAEVAEVERLAAESGCRATVLPTEVAFHSRQMDPLIERLGEAIAMMQPRQPELDIVSSIDPPNPPTADAAYWCRALRQPVRFAAAIDELIAMGVDTFVEIGPHPVLTIFAEETAAAAARSIVAVPTLQRGANDGYRLAETLAALWERGVPVDWSILLGRPRGRQALPRRIPGEMERHWTLSPLVSSPTVTIPAADESVEAANLDGPLDDQVAQHVGAVMRSAAQLDRHVPLQALGFDSLMAVELKKRLERTYDITLPASLLLASPSIVNIASAVEQTLSGADAVALLSDREVDRMLARLLESQ